MLRIDATESDSELQRFLDSRKENRREVSASLLEIRDSVQKSGWEAIARYTAKFDGVEKAPEASAFRVNGESFNAARSSLDADLERAIETSIARVRTFHSKQKRGDWYHDEEGIRTGQLFRPLERVGVYAPAGTAPLFSTLIMNTVPAQVAGCPSIVVCSPPQRDTGTVHPLILATCGKLGLTHEQVWSIGSAWSVFALAYGLPEFPKVDGIFGPGNVFVMEAKRLVQGEVRIESLPGNSEILVIADAEADPTFVAADLLSQAEHAGGEMSILVTDSEELMDSVDREVGTLLSSMARKEIAENSIRTGGVLVRVRDLDQACDIANRVAAEHLEIQVKNPESLIEKIRHAGAIFVGPWATEPIGDYTAGTNHVLPTGGTARHSSALSVDDFMKKISLIQLDQEGVAKIGPPAMRLAEAEGLLGHKTAIEMRLKH
jgi:histidinol dehydrogenase